MKSDYVEVKCGNCRHWFPWKAFALKGELSERRAVQKGNATGCDGKCCCYEGTATDNYNRLPRVRDSSDTYTASHCDFYSPVPYWAERKF